MFFEGLELDFGLQNGAPEWRWLLPWTATGADKCLPLLFLLPPRPCNKYSLRFDRVVPSSSAKFLCLKPVLGALTTLPVTWALGFLALLGRPCKLWEAL